MKDKRVAVFNEENEKQQLQHPKKHFSVAEKRQKRAFSFVKCRDIREFTEESRQKVKEKEVENNPDPDTDPETTTQDQMTNKGGGGGDL